MASLSTIKNWFKTGLRPTQAQFWATWDSFRHKDEAIPLADVSGLQDDLDDKVDKIPDMGLSEENFTTEEKLALANLSASGTPSYRRINCGIATTADGENTTFQEFVNRINAYGFSINQGELIVLAVGGKEKKNGVSSIVIKEYKFYPNGTLGGWGNGTVNGAIQISQLGYERTNILYSSSGELEVIELGDIEGSTIQAHLGALPNGTHDLLDNGTDYFFSCIRNGSAQVYEYKKTAPIPVSFGDSVPLETHFDLQSDVGNDVEPAPTESGHTFGGEITTNTTLSATHKGNKWFRIVGSPVITVPSGLLEITDNPIFKLSNGNPEFVNGSGFSLRGNRDSENRFFYNNDSYRVIGLIDCSSTEATIFGALKGGTIGAVVTSNYTSIAPSTTGDVTVTGVGFSANMKAPAITGNATLNSWTFIDGSSIIMNLTTTGTDGDKLTITYDNGELTTDTDAITLENLANFVIETTSTSATWSPQKVTHTGSTLVWTVSGGSSGVYNADKPTIDLSGNTGTAIITVTNITTLTELWAYSLNIKTVDLSVLTGLTDLRLYSNQLTILDLSNNTLLTSALVYSNPALSNLNLTGLESLTNLRIQSCNLSTIDLSTNTALTDLFANNNSLNGIDLSNNTALTKVILSSNGLTALDVTANTLLVDLTISSNNFTVLPDISTLTVLKTLDISSNVGITSLTIDNSSIETLGLISCGLTSLNVSSGTGLKTLNCYTNSLTSLDLSNNTALKLLHCATNSLTVLDVSANPVLSSVNCINNSLTVSGINQLIIDMDKNITTGTRYFRYDGTNASPTATENTTNDVIDAYNAMDADGYTLIGAIPS